MAILGFLTHTLPESAVAVEEELAGMPELSTYGVHKECYVVTVAAAPSVGMEALVNRVRAVEGVIAVYVTSFTTEDEEEESSYTPAFNALPPDLA